MEWQGTENPKPNRPLPLWRGIIHVSDPIWPLVEAVVEEQALTCPDLRDHLEKQPYNDRPRKRQERGQREKRDPENSKRARWGKK